MNVIMNKMIFAVALLLCSSVAAAQVQNDPIIMTINGQNISRSEFEYSYNKNNGEGVIDKKSVDDYVDMFINYKLKVLAAEDAKLDTMASFINEFASYRDQQIRPAIITDADVENEAHKIYDEACVRINKNGGMVKAAHILLMLNQLATKEQQNKAKTRIDSIYKVLKAGADFAGIARKYSDDRGSAANGGELPWAMKGQFVEDFEDVLFSLKVGEISKPFLSPFGYHIILLKEKSPLFENVYSYSSQHKDILKFIEMRNLREQIIDNKLDSTSKAEKISKDDVLAKKRESMIAKDSQLKYLIQEYHDGLLMYEISNRCVWNKASKDSIGLDSFFKKHKNNYRWKSPRFRGIAYSTKNIADIKAVQKSLKNISFDKWAECLRKQFNNDSIMRIRVEKGIFKLGDNALVDKNVFGKDTTLTQSKDFPYSAVFGKKIIRPEVLDDVRAQVVADYQDELEKHWVEELRKRYSVVVNHDILQTVNKH